MCTSIAKSQDDNVRSLCAVLVRRRVQKSLFEQLSPQSQTLLKSTLLSAIQQEKVPSVRRKLADTTGEVGSMILQSNQWPEILDFVFQAGRAESPDLRVGAMLVFSRLSFVVGEKLLPYLAIVCDLLQSALQDPRSLEVRLAALSAAAGLAQALAANEDRLAAIAALAPAMLAAIGGALNAQDEAAARAGLEGLIAVAEEAPRFYRRSMDALVTLCFAIVDAKPLAQETRFLAIELLLTLAEQARGRAPVPPAARPRGRRTGGACAQSERCGAASASRTPSPWPLFLQRAWRACHQRRRRTGRRGRRHRAGRSARALVGGGVAGRALFWCGAA